MKLPVFVSYALAAVVLFVPSATLAKPSQDQSWALFEFSRSTNAECQGRNHE